MGFIEEINQLDVKNNDEFKVVTSTIKNHIKEEKLRKIKTVGYPFSGPDTAWPTGIFESCTHLVMFDAKEFGDFENESNIANFKKYFGLKGKYINISKPSACGFYETFDAERFFMDFKEQTKGAFPVGYLAAIRLRVFLGCSILQVSTIKNENDELIATELHFEHEGVKKKLTHVNMRIDIRDPIKNRDDSLLLQKINYWRNLSNKFDALLIKGVPKNLLENKESREIAIGNFYLNPNGIILTDVMMNTSDKQQPIFNTTCKSLNLL